MSTTEELHFEVNFRFEEQKKDGPTRPFPHERRLQKREEGENTLVSARARLDSVPCHYLPPFPLSSQLRVS